MANELRATELPAEIAERTGQNGASLSQPPSDPLPAAAAPALKPVKRLQYNCAKCPGYCCSYPIIDVTPRDIRRLARHFGLEPEIAEARFTRPHEKKRVMRRKDDTVFGRICRFFDTGKRRCTIYEARPAVCRTYPEGRCGYYDFLSFERKLQDDKNWVIEIDHR